MFDTCTHGFLALTCPHCKGSALSSTSTVDSGDESCVVDMGAILERAENSIARTVGREARAVNRELQERYA